MSEATAAAAGLAAPGAPQMAPGGTALTIADPSQLAAQGSFYTAQPGYYPTVSYSTGQQYQVMSPYQYVIPQAAYPQPTYGWAYYQPGTQPTRPEGGAQVINPGLGVLSVKQDPTQLSEREQKALRRKQANRESARRSKIRKKAESEDLGKRADGLVEQNKQISEELELFRAKFEELKAKNDQLRMQAAENNISLDDMPPIDIDSFRAPESLENGVDESPASTGPVGQHYDGGTAACGTSVLHQ